MVSSLGSAPAHLPVFSRVDLGAQMWLLHIHGQCLLLLLLGGGTTQYIVFWTPQGRSSQSQKETATTATAGSKLFPTNYILTAAASISMVTGMGGSGLQL